MRVLRYLVAFGGNRITAYKETKGRFQQRAYPIGYIPAGTPLRALRQLDRMEEERTMVWRSFLAPCLSYAKVVTVWVVSCRILHGNPPPQTIIVNLAAKFLITSNFTVLADQTRFVCPPNPLVGMIAKGRQPSSVIAQWSFFYTCLGSFASPLDPSFLARASPPLNFPGPPVSKADHRTYGLLWLNGPCAFGGRITTTPVTTTPRLSNGADFCR